ncbi:hypothetical protein ACFL1H_03120 [Nanoarchaeota archaeon]
MVEEKYKIEINEKVYENIKDNIHRDAITGDFKKFGTIDDIRRHFKDINAMYSKTKAPLIEVSEIIFFNEKIKLNDVNELPIEISIKYNGESIEEKIEEIPIYSFSKQNFQRLTIAKIIKI